MHPTAEKKHLGTHTDTQIPRVNVPVSGQSLINYH